MKFFSINISIIILLLTFYAVNCIPELLTETIYDRIAKDDNELKILCDKYQSWNGTSTADLPLRYCDPKTTCNRLV